MLLRLFPKVVRIGFVVLCVVAIIVAFIIVKKILYEIGNTIYNYIGYY